MKKELTIGILVCDKDVDFLERILKSIKTKVKNIDYEIICYDNRENISKKLEFENVTILGTGGGNIKQLAARKHIIENANGELLWFIDADDDIEPISKENLHFDFDISCYEVYTINDFKPPYYKKKHITVQKPPHLKDEIYGDEVKNLTFHDVLFSCWNKIFKTSVLKIAASYVNDDERISASEDCYYVAVALANSNSLIFDKKPIYIFDVLNSASAQIDYSDCYEKFQRCSFGLKRAMDLIKEHGSDVMKEAIENQTVWFFLKKIASTKSIEVSRKMFKEIYNAFSLEAIIYTLEKECLNFTYEQHSRLYSFAEELDPQLAAAFPKRLKYFVSVSDKKK